MWVRMTSYIFPFLVRMAFLPSTQSKRLNDEIFKTKMRSSLRKTDNHSGRRAIFLFGIIILYNYIFRNCYNCYSSCKLCTIHDDKNIYESSKTPSNENAHSYQNKHNKCASLFETFRCDIFIQNIVRLNISGG